MLTIRMPPCKPVQRSYKHTMTPMMLGATGRPQQRGTMREPQQAWAKATQTGQRTRHPPRPFQGRPIPQLYRCNEQSAGTLR